MHRNPSRMAWPALGGLALVALLALAACATGGRGGVAGFDNAGFGSRSASPGYIVDRGGSGAGA